MTEIIKAHHLTFDQMEQIARVEFQKGGEGVDSFICQSAHLDACPDCIEVYMEARRDLKREPVFVRSTSSSMTAGIIEFLKAPNKMPV